MSESKQEFVVKKLDIKDAILLPTAAQPIVEKKPDVTKIPMVNMKKSVSLEKPSKIFVAKKPAPAAKKLTPPSTQPEIKPVITNATTLVSKDIALREAAVLPPPQFECKSFVELSREYRSARQQMLNETQRQQAQRSAPKVSPARASKTYILILIFSVTIEQRR